MIDNLATQHGLKTDQNGRSDGLSGATITVNGNCQIIVLSADSSVTITQGSASEPEEHPKS